VRGDTYRTDNRLTESRKRPQQDPHPFILPPPVLGQPGYPRAERRPAAEKDLKFSLLTRETTGAQTTSSYSPGFSTSPHSNLQPPQAASSGMSSRIPPPRNSPGEGRQDSMSLGNIMERRPDTGIDRGMPGRLDRKSL